MDVDGKPRETVLVKSKVSTAAALSVLFYDRLFDFYCYFARITMHYVIELVIYDRDFFIFRVIVLESASLIFVKSWFAHEIS